MPGQDVVERRRGRGRRPSEQVRAEILEAAGDLLLGEGLGAFGIERVAERAGASKTTIYKRWGSRGALAVAAYAERVGPALAVPDTGDVESDLRDALRAFVRLLRDTPAGPVTAELVGGMRTDPRLAAAFREVYLGPRRAAGIARLASAVAAGQIDRGTDLEVLSDQLWGACMYRLLTGAQPLDDAYVDQLLRSALRGAGT